MHAPQIFYFRISRAWTKTTGIISGVWDSVVKVMFSAIGVDRWATHVLIDGLEVRYHIQFGLPLVRAGDVNRMIQRLDVARWRW